MSKPVTVSSKGGYLIRPELRAHIERICHEQELGKRALAYVWGSIDDGPSRKVESLGSNVIVNFHSRKTGLRLMLESRKGELPNAVLLEHDDNVVAFFAQPRSVDLTPVDEDGKARTRKVYTPDFLIVFRDRIVIREARDEGFIIKKNLQNPFHTYRDDSTGRWHYRPAENYFADLGLNYEYVCNQSLPGQLVDNMRFLDGHLAGDRAPVDANRIAELADAVNEARSISLHELLARGFSADEIYPAIADGAIYFDLENECLSNSPDMVVYADKVLAKVARIERIARQEPPLPVPGTFAPAVDAELTVDGKIFKVVNFGRTDTLLADSAGNITARRTAEIVYAHQRGYITGGEATRGAGGKRLDEIGMPALKRAVERLEAVRSGNRGRFSERSMARFQAAVVGAENEEEKLKRLIDQADQRGNRISKITPEGRELIEKTIRDFYDTPQCRTYKGAWDKYVGLCATQSEETGVEMAPVSYPTFTKLAAQLTNTKARLGKRAADSIEPIYTSLEDNLPVRGEYPHEVCHIDHTIANMALVSPRGVALGKPTLTIGVDGCTTHPRAMYLSFDPPSLLQVLMLLRDYVRRHQQLPRILVVDNGSDLRSKGLGLFCAIYGIELRFRPPGKARFGNVIERLMGATEVEVFKELKGYTGILKKDARTVTKSVNPFNHACWTLPGLHAVTEWYLFEERPGRIHPVLGMTPDEFEAKRLVETGSRDGRTVHFNSNLLLMTSPHPHRVLHKVDPQRGVWVGGVWFNHPALARLSRREKVEVRIEPWLRSVVYVHVNNRWVTAVGRFPTWVGQRSSREVDLALREEAKRSTSSAQRSSVTPDKRTSRQLSWRPEAFDPRLHVQQEEARHIYEQLAMTLATPEAEQVAASLGRSTELNQPAASPPAADVPAQQAQSVEPRGVEAALDAPASNAPADPEPAKAADSITLPPTRSIASTTPIAVDPVDAPAPEATAPAVPRPTPARDSALSRISRFH